MTPPLPTINPLRPTWIVVFSGHRPSDSISGRSVSDLKSCRSSLRDAFDELRTQAQSHNGSIELMCSLAEGSDLLAIDVAQEMDIPVHLILPLSIESFANDYKDKQGVENENWNSVNSFISKAQDPLSSWTFRVAMGDNTRPGCYHETNHQMLESADVLVAICLPEGDQTDSSTPALIGGTSEIIQMADKKHFDLPTIILDPSQNGRVYRKDKWNVDQESLDLLKELNQDLASEGAHKSSAAYQRGGEDEIWTIHQALDNIANNQGRRFRRCFERSVWFHFWATALAATAATFAYKFHDHHLDSLPIILTFTELLLVVVATISVRNAQKTSTNFTWRRSRFGAELVDSQIHSAVFVDPLRPISMKYNNIWKRFALVVALTAHRQVNKRLASLNSEDTFTELKSNYLENRVTEQRKYLSAKQRAAASRFHFCNRVAYWSSVFALLVISSALIIKTLHKYESASHSTHGVVSHDVYGEHNEHDKTSSTEGKGWTELTFIYFLPILLPLIAGLSSSLIVASDAARRSSRFQQVENRLKGIERVLPTVRTFSAMQPLVIEVEDEILDEMIEWHASAQSMDHMH